jgi:hypothetical protein
MTAVSLSRWTMSYFAAALTALVAAEMLMVAGYGFPSVDLRAPETLILVHVVAIGWLSLLMCGALIQFVPVLVAKPLYSDVLPLPALVCLIAGLAGLVLGFLQLVGRVGPAPPWLALGGGLLGLGFALVLWNLGRTLWPARPLPLPARFVAIGLASIAATACLGIVFALVLGGAASDGPFIAFAAAGLPLHIAAGLGGWLTFTAMGVSYRLLAMFMLAPDLDGRRTHAVFYLGTGALAAIVLGGGLAIQLGAGFDIALGLAGILGLAAVTLYAADMLHLYGARRRRHVELNSRMAALALASLVIAAALMAGLAAFGRLTDHAGAVVFLIAFGWLSGLALAKLYKVVAFLTWLECYGPVLGKAETPRVQDLVDERRATKWFLLFFAAVWCATAALLLRQAPAFQVAAGGMLLATIGIVVQLVRARRLVDVNAECRFPAGAHRPRLLLSLGRQT